MEGKPTPISTEGKNDLEVWKYYGGVGGADKNTMIKIVTWLLGFSTAIIGAYATETLTDDCAKKLLVIVGILISLLAAFVTLLYGGYALWNWGIADRIAEKKDWEEQKPDYRPFKDCKPHWASKFSLSLAKPCKNKIAPVFWVFFFVSLASAIVHGILFVHAT